MAGHIEHLRLVLTDRPFYTARFVTNVADIGGVAVSLAPDYNPDRLNISGVSGTNNFVGIAEGNKNSVTVFFARGSQGNAIFIGGQSIFGQRLFIYVNGTGNTLFLGEKSAINGLSVNLVGHGRRVTIGDGCLCSVGVNIRTHDQHGIIDLNTGDIINPAKDVHLEPYVWLGKDVSVHGGVTVGCGAILGERALVTKDIPRLSIAVGAPARVLKTNCAWTMDWNEGPEHARKIAVASQTLTSIMPANGRF